MKPTVYLETTVIGYLAMRVSGLLRVAANQQTARDWWDNHRQRFDLFVSRFVLDECSNGDPAAVQERLVYLEGIPLLQITDEVNSLAEALRVGVPLPEKAVMDALLISVATINTIQYLLTWNCKHIANPSLRTRIERLCRVRTSGDLHSTGTTGDRRCKLTPLWPKFGRYGNVWQRDLTMTSVRS